MKKRIISAIAGAAILGTAAFAVNVKPSQNPPGNLEPVFVPQFVSIGFDDGFAPQAIKAITDHLYKKNNPEGGFNPATFDGVRPAVTYYFNGYLAEGETLNKWIYAHDKGNEVGNHTYSHSESGKTNKTVEFWDNEVSRNNNKLKESMNVTPIGFRTPYLAAHDATFTALENNGIKYDISLEEGFQPGHDGTNYLWPYTLDNGSPGNDYLYKKGRRDEVKDHPGLWEVGVRALVIPPEINEVVKGKYKSDDFSQYDPETGKITNLDFTLFDVAQMTPDEALATWKHTLDLRLKGNRAPLILGAHPQFYPNSPERLKALLDFIDYAMSKEEVRFVPVADIVNWMESPAPLFDPANMSRITSSVVGTSETVEKIKDSVEKWDASIGYGMNAFVQFDGNVYQSNDWWHQGDSPDSSAKWQEIDKTPYTEEVTVTVYNGKIEPSGNVIVKNGEEQLFTITPNSGYIIKTILVDGKPVGHESKYNFANVEANHTIEAEFAKENSSNI